MPRPLVPPQLMGTPFTSAQARAAGLTAKCLQSSPWRRIFRDVWVHRGLEDTRELRLAAARLVLPSHGVLFALTAAWLHGVDVRRESDLDVHASFPKGRRIRSQPGLKVCQETLDEQDIVMIDGVQVTTPLRTAFDCARLLTGVDRIVVVDALAHANLVAVQEIRHYCQGKRRLRHLRTAQGLLDICDAGAESPMETRTRMVLVRGGLPPPETQINAFDPRTGMFIGRIDMGYREWMIAVEYDGAFHWEQRRKDDRRRDRLRAAGWYVLVVSADDIYQRPGEVVAAVAAAIRDARRRTAGTAR
jgi:hypothetical protein